MRSDESDEPNVKFDRPLDSSLRDVKQDDSNNKVAPSRGDEQIDDVLDGLVGAGVGGFKSAVWAILRVRTAVEAAVGKWSAQPQDDSNNEVALSRGGEQIDDVLDGLFGAVVGGFKSAVWAILGGRAAVEAAVGKCSAQPFVEEQK